MATRNRPTGKASLTDLATAFCIPLRRPGVFPRPGILQFIGRKPIGADSSPAMVSDSLPLIMGVVVAADIDDQTVIRFRRGHDARSVPAVKFYLPNPVPTARRIMEQVVLHKPAAVFIDTTGIGAAVHAQLLQLRCPHLGGVDVDGPADRFYPGDEPRYSNKRAEMWGAMKQWIKAGYLPRDPDLLAALASVEYAYDGNDAIQLERKYDTKRRGMPSPDDADALALTFAYPVVLHVAG